jgi:GNAT superfamily N-acetyltransferase
MIIRDTNWHFFGSPKVIMESQEDTQRWGVKTYRIFPKNASELGIEGFPKNPFDLDGDVFVIARIETKDIQLAREALEYGYRLCDTLVYWEGKCVKSDEHPPEAGYWARPIEDCDKRAIAEITREAFSGYSSHYSADSKLENVDEAYIDWATRAKDGIVITKETIDGPCFYKTPVAYGTFGTSGDKCELVLGGVLKEHRGKGLYEHLVHACMNWGLSKGVEKIQISTQITNLSVQRVWANLGLKPSKSYYTLHYWGNR